MTALTVAATVTTGRRQLVNVRQRSLLVAKWRVLWVLTLFAAIALCALLRIAFLGVFEPSRAASIADALLPDRGEIVDRNGAPLARAFNAYALWFNPKSLGDGPALVKSPAEVAAALVHIFPDMDPADLARRLAAGKAGYLRAGARVPAREPALLSARLDGRAHPGFRGR
jgi:cell division protein FtsI (penicillin-binding protein 3)